MSNAPSKQLSHRTHNRISISGDTNISDFTSSKNYNSDFSDNLSLSTTVYRQEEEKRVVKNKIPSQHTNRPEDQTNNTVSLTQKLKEEQTNYTGPIKVDGHEYQEIGEDMNNDSNSGIKQQRYYYNEQTTYHLRKLFYETIGHGRKPTRQERHRLHEQTGVNPRKMTYYLSNMKRRHARELQEFRRLVNEGIIDGRYASYINYCNRPTITSEATSRQEEGEEEITKKEKLGS